MGKIYIKKKLEYKFGHLLNLDKSWINVFCFWEKYLGKQYLFLEIIIK